LGFLDDDFNLIKIVKKTEIYRNLSLDLQFLTCNS
jgi:hypothetical protein